MLAECVRGFRDLRENVYREAGERFEVEPERLAEINGTAYGQLAKQADEAPKPRRARKPKEG